MAYVVPQVLVFQELQLVPAADIQPLSAHISGGHADLIRWDEATEKADGLLGFYNDAVEECFLWPNRPAGAITDQDYTRVFMDNALLKYFEDFIGAGDTISTVAGKSNRIRAAATSFKANGASYPRDSQFEERDVQVGDVAKIRTVVGPDSYTLWTTVTGFVGEVVAAVVAAATADADNTATQSAPTAAATYTGPAALVNCIDVDSIDQSSYDGLIDGDINETYTVTVLTGSAGGDATTATLRVTSASGNDDVATVTPAAFGSPTTIGTRGLTVTWDDAASAACSLSADNNTLSDIDFIPGQVWQITCGQAFNAPSATSAGSYTGTENATYIIEVTKGGLYADSPEITVTTDKGIDASGPTVVSAASTAVAVGTKGVTVSFDETALNKGDRFFIGVTAETEGAIQTLILANNFDSAVIANGATESDLTLYIKKDIEISENRANTPGVTNWTQTATQICLAAGITALDSSWTVAGVPTPLPVDSEASQNFGDVYVTVRYWLPDLCGNVYSLHDISQLETAISGPLHPDNPLKWGVSKALANNNGRPVTYTSVCDPSVVENWNTVIELIDGRSDVYGLVPLTRNITVLNNFEAHVNSQSNEIFGRWRVLWTNQAGISAKVIVNSALSADGEEVLAELADDPDTTGTQYTLLTVPAGNGDFVTNGVAPADIVRFLYTTDGFGGEVYTEFVVDAVLNEDTLRLVTPGHTAAVNVAQKIEVHRNLTTTEQATELGLTNGFSNKRVMSVWPDTVGAGGLTFEGYHLCAALAGLVSGVVPHQGLTNLAISGFDDITRTTDLFNRTQLDSMAENGVWIVTQDLQSGQVLTRHAVSTAPNANIKEREEMFTRNLDSISFFFLDLFAPYIGISNITDSLVSIIQTEMKAGIQNLRGRNFTQRLGGQLIDGEVVSIRTHATLKDRLVATVNLTLPFALNNLELHLVV